MGTKKTSTPISVEEAAIWLCGMVVGWWKDQPPEKERPNYVEFANDLFMQVTGHPADEMGKEKGGEKNG